MYTKKQFKDFGWHNHAIDETRNVLAIATIRLRFQINKVLNLLIQ